MEDRISTVQSATTTDSNPEIAGNASCISYRLDRLMAFSGGDSESFRQIMSSFIRSCGQNVKLFRKYLHEKNDEAVSELSHKMLTLFRHLDASEIVEPLSLLAQRKSALMGSSYFYLLGESVLEMIETLLRTIRKDEPAMDYPGKMW